MSCYVREYFGCGNQTDGDHEKRSPMTTSGGGEDSLQPSSVFSSTISHHLLLISPSLQIEHQFWVEWSESLGSLFLL